jgi:DNA polymerase III gamma/tau subunit
MQKYFTELLGNEESRERLGRAITEGTLPHAFLIGGPEGSGKKTFAK